MAILEKRIGRTGFALGYLPVLALVAYLAKTSIGHSWRPSDATGYLLFAVVFFWSICLTAWRCHDFGKSAWSNFWTEQIPLIGPFLGLWDLISKPGDLGNNEYGPVPRI